MKGKDVYGNPIIGPPEPRNRDEMDRARTIIYSLTARALQMVRDQGSGRPQDGGREARQGDGEAAEGGVLADGVLLRGGRWGDGRESAGAGLAVLKPALAVTVDKNGNELRGPNAYAWDYSSVVAVEVEMSPRRAGSRC